MPRDCDDDKPKRSWREIDQMKDRSKHRQADKTGLSPQKQTRANSASKVYKSQLDSFFDGAGQAPTYAKEKLKSLETNSEQGEKRIALLKAIKEAATSSAADHAVLEFLKEWELPPDYDVLSQVLLCSDERYLRQAMALLNDLLEQHRVPKRTQVLEQRLRRIKSLSDDLELQTQADALQKKLRLFQ
jgi:oligoribonuclease (3'-5' exoribonuclease)